MTVKTLFRSSLQAPHSFDTSFQKLLHFKGQSKFGTALTKKISSPFFPYFSASFYIFTATGSKRRITVPNFEFLSRIGLEMRQSVL